MISMSPTPNLNQVITKADSPFWSIYIEKGKIVSICFDGSPCTLSVCVDGKWKYMSGSTGPCSD